VGRIYQRLTDGLHLDQRVHRGSFPFSENFHHGFYICMHIMCVSAEWEGNMCKKLRKKLLPPDIHYIEKPKVYKAMIRYFNKDLPESLLV
jgi:hypothetical protein